MKLDEMKKRKAELGYSNEQISRLSGIPVSTIRKIFAGITKQPRYETLQALDMVLSQANRFSETTFQYMTKPQGEYTVEDLENFPEDAYVELIDGVLYSLSSPTIDHQTIASSIWLQLKLHVKNNKGRSIVTIAPCDVHLTENDNKTLMQPDLFITCDRSKIVNGRIKGAPDFVLEVLSPTTKKKDHSIKLQKYLEAGVREYWLIDQDKQKVIVYLLEEDIDTFLYTFDDKIPVAIWNNECYVDMKEVQEELDFIYDTSE